MSTSKTAELLLKVKTAGADAVDSLAESLDSIKEIGVAAFAAISAVIIKAIDEYKEAEEASNALNQSMVNQGIYSSDLRDAYDEQAQSLQKLTKFGDDEITSAQAILQTYLGQTKISKELTEATLNLATAKKMDLNTAAELVGKSIGTETNALARNGIEVTANASQQQKLAEVLDGIEGKWSGQAKAAAQGLGTLEQLQNVVGDLFEVIGERLAPVVTLFSRKLIGLGTDTATTTPILDGFLWVVQQLVRSGIIVGGVFDAVSKVISINLGTAIGAISQVLDGQFKNAWTTLKQSIDDYKKVLPDTYQATMERIKEVDAAFLQSKSVHLDKEVELVRASKEKESKVKEEFAASEAAKKLEQDILQQQIDMQLLEASEENRARVQLQARIKAQEQILKTTTDSHKKLAAQQEIFNLNELQKQAIIDKQKEDNFKATLGVITSLQNSSNKNLAMIGKAAALTQIAIATPEAVAKAYTLGPIAGPIAAGLVYTAMAAQAAQVAGIPLAEGGLVHARPGGVQTTIGEGGEDELVTPLSKLPQLGLGGGGGSITVNFNGPVMGDASQAREFAIEMDRQLLRLRQNGESVSFDERVT